MTQLTNSTGLETDFRNAMAAVGAPVAVVTTGNGDTLSGTTVSAFCSLSMKPPMMLVTLDNTSRLLSEIRQSVHFGVNLLDFAQHSIARNFATKSSDKFAGVDFTQQGHAPRIAGGAGWVHCELHAAYQAGDHTILVGLVTEAAVTGRPPLTYHNKTFGTPTEV